MYIIRRTDQGGGWMAPPGSLHSYTGDPLKAQRFASYDAAKAYCCPDNEVAENLSEMITEAMR